MFSRTANLYDLIYSTRKDYRGEAQRIGEIIREEVPGATALLDVACGTGEHARILRNEYGFAVDGVDLQPEFVEISQKKNPGGSFRVGDMRGFQLGRSYDAILCLFSSIGYVKTLENVERTLVNFRKHLRRNGVVLVEPWLTPEVFESGRVDISTAESEDVKVCRMSRSDLRDGLSVIEFGYIIGSAGSMRFEKEIHEAGLFATEDLRETFERAGFDVKYDPEGFIGRGLFVATAP